VKEFNYVPLSLFKGWAFCFGIVVDKCLTVFGPMHYRKNEWTNHAIAWYKHAI